MKNGFFLATVVALLPTTVLAESQPEPVSVKCWCDGRQWTRATDVKSLIEQQATGLVQFISAKSRPLQVPAPHAICVVGRSYFLYRH